MSLNELLEEIKKRLVDTKSNGEIKRIFEEEPETIVKEKSEQKTTYGAKAPQTKPKIVLRS